MNKLEPKQLEQTPSELDNESDRLADQEKEQSFKDKWRHYFEAANEVGITLLGALGMTLVAQGASALFPEATTFKTAIHLLQHYAEEPRPILAFFAVPLWLLCLSLVLEPGCIARAVRRWVVLPSLQIAAHMFTLMLAVIFAELIVELGKGIPRWAEYCASFELKDMVIAIGIILLFIGLCSLLPVYFKHYFDKTLAEINEKYCCWVLVLIGMGGLVIISGTVWHYRADVRTEAIPPRSCTTPVQAEKPAVQEAAPVHEPPARQPAQTETSRAHQ